MSTVNDSKTIVPGYEPITGYTLEEKIGQGGFGEVWRADAPGGIKKAVKFVFGATDQSRGSRELKSLERIKGVHHPFLLTLERFGIVDDQLVIVTELADGSLEDIYDRHRKRGSCGIPRQALLAYLHDAADALDYLHSNYQLQHLDIKPGNLLLVGGHVKVGDFGLLKDLREADCSVVGGLTPIYAPPEVFDGRPTLQSDQYSMAVMYQELLTGTRPFSGRTIAQLATQHVHSAPNLEPLPPGDRPVVAKALEKNPERRFGNCIEFVDALREVQHRSSQLRRQVAENSRDDTIAVSGTGSSGAQPAIEDLPQLDSRAALQGGRATSHSLVVALGGAGAECLHELRSRVAKLHSVCPVDLHSVLIDCDMATIHAAKLAEMSDRVPHTQLVYTPLKSAHEYRRDAQERFRSISRRWIYNVPRSGKTEGMRPLGRLAMVDHGAEIKAALVDAIEHLAAVAGEQTPNIYVVGSIAGGAGGGMYLDIVHLLRHLLDDAGLQQTKVLSLMAASPLQANPRNPLGLHDTLATLQELRYYMQPGNGYPGDEGAGFPSVPAARTPLHNTYLVSGSLSGRTSASPTETITDYLWADSTGANELLAAARKESDGDERLAAKPSYLRSVGVVRLGCLRALEENLLSPALVRHLLLRWLGRPAEAKQIALPLSQRLSKRCEINFDDFRDAFLERLAPDPSERRELLLRQLRTLQADVLADTASTHRIIDDLANRAMRTDAGETLVAAIMVSLNRELAVRLHDRRIDLTSAVEALGMLIESCDRMIDQQNPSVQEQQASVASMPPGGADSETMAHLDAACQYGESALTRHAVLAAIEMTHHLKCQLVAVKGRYETQAATVAHAIQKVAKSDAADDNPWSDMPQEIQMRFEPLLEKLHVETANATLLASTQGTDVIAGSDNYIDILTGAALPLVELAVDAANDLQGADEQAEARESGLVTATLTVDPEATQTMELKSKSTYEMAGSSAAPGERWNEQTTIESALEAVRPALLDCGGRQRLLLLVGSEGEREQLEAKMRAAHGGELSVLMVPGITPMLVHEAQQIRIDDVMNRLSVIAAGDRQVSGRLHSRADVDWNAGVSSSGFAESR
ncbi:MAG: protein kinase [Planctomycetota bacterium]